MASVRYVLGKSQGKAFIVKLLLAGIAHERSDVGIGWIVHVRERHKEATKLHEAVEALGLEGSLS